MKSARPFMSRFIFVIALLAVTSSCAQFREHRVGVVSGSLTQCPQWPRCVSSMAVDPDKQVMPFTIKGDADKAWQRAIGAVGGMDRTKIVTQQGNYLHAEMTSPWGMYTDDLELLLQAKAGLIQVRSSGRIGYYDFNVNRERIEVLRALLAD